MLPAHGRGGWRNSGQATLGGGALAGRPEPAGGSGSPLRGELISLICKLRRESLPRSLAGWAEVGTEI